MKKVFKDNKIGGVFQFSSCEPFARMARETDDHMKIIINQSGYELVLTTDGVEVLLAPGSALFATYMQKVRCKTVIQDENIKFITFNQPFYCVHTNDSEVSCGGLLFFGSSHIPVIAIPESIAGELNHFFCRLESEFDTRDQNQEEMLRMMLKQLIIRFTRLGRDQLLKNSEEMPDAKTVDLIRKFNVLVEEHFREKKQVSDYAELLYKSPKTIDNIFRKHSTKTPLTIIHERVLLEAKRLLIYSDKSLQQITWEIGLEDPAQFSRFFKKKTGLTPGSFREEGLRV